MRAIRAALAFIAMFTAASPGFSQVSGSWGMRAGRGNAGDVVDLVNDITRLLYAERAFAEGPQKVARIALEGERQKQKMGTTADSDAPDIQLSDVHAQLRAWWTGNVLQPALDIARNPASSCGVARSMVERVAKVVREAQVVGLADETFGGYGDSGAILRIVFTITQRRCIEEAFDECLLTGNIGAFTSTIGAFAHQADIYGRNDPEWDDSVLYLIRRCSVYKLDYRLVMLNQAMRGSRSEWEGSILLLFEAQQETDLITRVAAASWEGPREKDEDQTPDIRLLSVRCERPLTNCDRDPAESSGGASARVTMRRQVDEQIPIGLTGTGTVETRSSSHTEGEDLLTLHFAPPLVLFHATESGNLLEHQPPSGTDWFRIATQSLQHNDLDLPRMSNGVRVNNYPVLFRANSSAQGSLPWMPSESTTFELIHRPDLFPADERRPDYEKTQSKPPRMSESSDPDLLPRL